MTLKVKVTVKFKVIIGSLVFTNLQNNTSVVSYPDLSIRLADPEYLVFMLYLCLRRGGKLARISTEPFIRRFEVNNIFDSQALSALIDFHDPMKVTLKNYVLFYSCMYKCIEVFAHS